MGQVTFAINGRSYRIGCADGEEPRLRQLAREIGQRVDRLVMEFGQVGEARLLLMVALLATDDLLDVRANLDVLVAEAAERLHMTVEVEKDRERDTRDTRAASGAKSAPAADEPSVAGPAAPPLATEALKAAATPAAPEKVTAAAAQPTPPAPGKPRPPRIELPGKARSA